jgi:hypothetical protein
MREENGWRRNIYVKASEENTDGGSNILNSAILEQNQVTAGNHQDMQASRQKTHPFSMPSDNRRCE